MYSFILDVDSGKSNMLCSFAYSWVCFLYVAFVLVSNGFGMAPFFSLAHNREWESASIQYNFIQLNCGLVEPTKISFKDIQTDTRRNSLCWLTMQKRERERVEKGSLRYNVSHFEVSKSYTRKKDREWENESVVNGSTWFATVYIAHHNIKIRELPNAFYLGNKSHARNFLFGTKRNTHTQSESTVEIRLLFENECSHLCSCLFFGSFNSANRMFWLGSVLFSAHICLARVQYMNASSPCGWAASNVAIYTEIHIYLNNNCVRKQAKRW